MKTGSSVALLLTLALTANAQITTSLNRKPDGADEITIRNDSSKSLVAFAVTARELPRSPNSISAPHVFYFDPVIEPAIQPLAVGEERLVVRRWFASGRGNSPAPRVFQEPITVAAIFADGTTFGDAALLNRLILRRSNMLLAVEISLDVLVDAGNRNVAREQLIKQFGKMSDYLNRWYVPPEQQVGRSVYQSMVGKLMNLPQQPVGSPFPPSAFVTQETAALNRQRVMLLESQPSLENATLIAR
jgi:hypothetical protein